MSLGTTLRHLWREQKLLLIGFALACAVALFFAVRMVGFWIYWADPAHRNQAIEGWMTPRYVAHSWHVPPEIVADALGLAPGTGRVTVEELAARRGVPVEQVVQEITEAILAHRAKRADQRP